MLQSLSGLTSYFCSDCKKYYDSASSLLNHFAQHITQKHDFKTNCSDSEDDSRQTFLTYNQNKRKKESILEKVLKQTVTSQAPRDTSSPISSSTSEYYTSSSSDIDNSPSEQEREIPLPVIELGNQNLPHSQIKSNLMLVKFDLQTRLEDCIVKLAAKRDSKMESTARSVLNISQDTWKSSGLPVIKSKDLTVSLASTTNSAEVDEFSPLKFCVVTMGEGDDKLDIGTNTLKHSPGEICLTKVATKTSSNRKQLTPKKIVSVNKKQDEVVNIIKDKIATKKKYPCLVCHKVFGWSTDLKRHMLTHTGERPFKCQQCPATFTRNFLLQKHESKQHQASLCSGVVPNDPPVTGLEDLGKPTSVSQVSAASEKEAEELHLERKRKLQQSLSDQFDSSIIEKRLGSYKCSSINVGIFSQQALNIM